MMTPAEKNRRVATLIGWEIRDAEHTWYEDIGYGDLSEHIEMKPAYFIDGVEDCWVEDWNPYRNLIQAVRYLIPWIEKQTPECWYHLIDQMLYYDHPMTKESTWNYTEGVGDTPDEIMASALVECCLKIGGEK